MISIKAMYWMSIHSEKSSKAIPNIKEKYIAKRAGASTRPCFMPLLTSNSSASHSVIIRIKIFINSCLVFQMILMLLIYLKLRGKKMKIVNVIFQ